MEINNTTVCLYYTNRVLGFAPYALQKNKLNRIVNVKESRFLLSYSVFMIIGLGILTNYGLYYDATSEHPIR